jgi:hypothetical protein
LKCFISTPENKEFLLLMMMQYWRRVTKSMKMLGSLRKKLLQRSFRKLYFHAKLCRQNDWLWRKAFHSCEQKNPLLSMIQETFWMNTAWKRVPLSVILIPMLGRLVILFRRARYVTWFICKEKHLLSLKILNIFKHIKMLTNLYTKTLLIIFLSLHDFSSSS